MKCYVFFRSGISGGTATLSIRVSQKLISEGYNVTYLYINNNDINNYRTLIKMGVSMIKINQAPEVLPKKDTYVFITYTIEEHARICYLFRKHKNKTVLLLPVSNSYTGVGFYNCKPLMLIDKMFAKQYIKYLCRTNLLMFTSESTKLRYDQFFKIGDYKGEYYYIPIDVPNFDRRRCVEQFRADNRRIITVLRCDFPLKGYVFGLIEEFISFCERNSEAKLLIIATGEKIDLIKEKIRCCNRIELLDGCSYEQLQIELKKSYINVGHGTSVLDAAVNSLVTLLGIEYSYSRKTAGYYAVCDSITGKKNEGQRGYGDYFDWLYSCKEDEYVYLCEKDWKNAERKNSIEQFIEKLHRNEVVVSNISIPKYRYMLIRIKTAFDSFVRSLYRHIKKKEIE